MKVKAENFMNSRVSPLLVDGKPMLWIFGYGSLLWHPGFKYETSAKGMAAGYTRRFYQGNTTYRGTAEKPGRVVTLIESANRDDATYGLLFKVSGWAMVYECLEHLYMREIENGYSFRVIDVTDLDSGRAIQALTCIALKSNSFYLGDANNDEKTIALQIAACKGYGGPNSEYLLKLAKSARELFPDVDDEHLYQLERMVLALP